VPDPVALLTAQVRLRQLDEWEEPELVARELQAFFG